MEKIIYIQLLNEGSVAYRPVPAIEVGSNIYKVQGDQIYEPEDETWEFTPGMHVLVENRVLSGESVFVAIKSVS